MSAINRVIVILDDKEDGGFRKRKLRKMGRALPRVETIQLKDDLATLLGRYESVRRLGHQVELSPYLESLLRLAGYSPAATETAPQSASVAGVHA